MYLCVEITEYITKIFVSGFYPKIEFSSSLYKKIHLLTSGNLECFKAYDFYKTFSIKIILISKCN